LTESFWPSPTQDLLLACALASGDRAIAAWREARPQIDLDVLEPGSFELLPLVYRALAETDPDESWLPRLKGVYRRTWVKNNLLLERTRETADALAAAGVPALTLAGVPLAARLYPELGLRPAQFTVVLVDSVDAAATALRRARWFRRPDLPELPGLPAPFGDRDGNLCILWTSLGFDVVLREPPTSHVERLLAGAVPQELGEGTVPVPALGDLLFALVVSGARTGPTSGVQWIVDAAMAARQAQPEDWDRLVELGLEAGQALRLQRVLRRLAALPDVPIPPAVLDRLSAADVTRRDRLVYWGGTHVVRGLGGSPMLVAEHLVASQGASAARTVVSFPRHLRRRWQLEHGWQVPVAAGRRVLRALAGRRGA
jgi:hypothetical protein